MSHLRPPDRDARQRYHQVIVYLFHTCSQVFRKAVREGTEAFFENEIAARPEIVAETPSPGTGESDVPSPRSTMIKNILAQHHIFAQRDEHGEIVDTAKALSMLSRTLERQRDSSIWPDREKGPLEIAKLFLPTLPNEHVRSWDDLDIMSLMTILRCFTPLATPEQRTLLDRISHIRNTMVHSPWVELDRETARSYVTSMISAVESFGPNEVVDEAVRTGGILLDTL